jgi:hypothetical protein
MRRVRYAVALVVVVDFLVAVVQMQQAVIERASFQRPSVTTFGQYAVTLASKTTDDVDLWVRDPHGDIAWYAHLQAGALSLEHDQIPGDTDPASQGVHELTVIREATAGEYVANVDVFSGNRPASVTVELWDLRGWSRKVVFRRTLTVRFQGQQKTAFRWRLNSAGDYAGHNELQADLVGETQ